MQTFALLKQRIYRQNRMSKVKQYYLCTQRGATNQTDKRNIKSPHSISLALIWKAQTHESRQAMNIREHDLSDTLNLLYLY